MKQNEKIRRIAGFGMLASGFGIAITGLIFGAMVIHMFGGFRGFDLLEELDVKDIVSELTFAGRAVALAFWFMTDAIGFWFCCVAFALFKGFRGEGVFTLKAALRLRKIGWLIFALAPVSILSETIGVFAVTCLNNCGNAIADDVRVKVSLNDTDVYALVIGLLIIAVGHIFVEAVRLSDENEAFV